jgi:rhodanese-related sulfurtransferase
LINTITKEELMEKMKRNETFHLVDVRDTPDYQREHIVGAVHLLISGMTKESAETLFGKKDVIVTYSQDINCPAKNIAAQKMMDWGFTNVLAYQGSWMEWKEAGYPTEEG